MEEQRNKAVKTFEIFQKTLLDINESTENICCSKIDLFSKNEEQPLELAKRNATFAHTLISLYDMILNVNGKGTEIVKDHPIKDEIIMVNKYLKKINNFELGIEDNFDMKKDKKRSSMNISTSSSSSSSSSRISNKHNSSNNNNNNNNNKINNNNNNNKFNNSSSKSLSSHKHNIPSSGEKKHKNSNTNNNYSKKKFRKSY
jgi:hypothetical protein